MRNKGTSVIKLGLVSFQLVVPALSVQSYQWFDMAKLHATSSGWRYMQCLVNDAYKEPRATIGYADVITIGKVRPDFDDKD